MASTVYWLHLPEHTDIFNDGYVGVTPNLKKRIKEHKFKFKDLWHKIIVKQIVIADNNYCYEIEKKLRPQRNVGWNKAIGGYRNNSMIGKENPNYQQYGKDSPNFKGLYITPIGKFETSEEAGKAFNLNPMTIVRKCKGRIVNGRFLQPQSGWAFEQKDRVAS
jgi:hypothetical protein